MPGSAVSRLGTCLREARKAAGFANYGQAGIATHRSPEVVGRHERGDVQVQMDDAIQYAEAYNHPEILMSYCEQCAIREKLFGQCECSADNLPLTAVRLSNRLRGARGKAEQLETILDDGRIDLEDVPVLMDTLDYLKSVEHVWRELLTNCFANGIVGIKNDAPSDKGVRCQNYSPK